MDVDITSMMYSFALNYCRAYLPERKTKGNRLQMQRDLNKV
jgi:hypothetical protein